MFEPDKLYLSVIYEFDSGDGRKRVDVDEVVKELNNQIAILLGRPSCDSLDRDIGNIIRIRIGLFALRLNGVLDDAVKAVNHVYKCRLGIESAVLKKIFYQEGGSDEYDCGIGTFQNQIEGHKKAHKTWSASHNGKPRKLTWFDGF